MERRIVSVNKFELATPVSLDALLVQAVGALRLDIEAGPCVLCRKEGRPTSNAPLTFPTRVRWPYVDQGNFMPNLLGGMCLEHRLVWSGRGFPVKVFP